TAGQQSDLAFPEEGVDLKLLLNPRFGTQSRWASCRLKVYCLRAGCHLKVFLARVAALLVFHVLNVVLAISGASIILTFTVLSIVLLPISAMIPAFFACVKVTKERCSICTRVIVISFSFVAVSTVIIVLLGFLAFFIIFMGVLTGVPNLAVWGTGVQQFFVFFNIIAADLFASCDVELANFIVTRMPLQAYSAIQKDNTKLPEIPYDFCELLMWNGPVLDVFTTPMWTAVFYFLVAKLLTGVLSAVSVWLSVVQPIMVLASSGRFPCVGTGLTFQDNPSVYVVMIVMLWVVGVFGLVLIHVCSVKLTAWGYGTYIYEPEQQVQEDIGASQIGSLEATGVSSFVELEDPGARH
ncbi:hypothetical protein BBJ28_00009976, partial [Nothophytophthora sp. Chile5]